MISRIDHVAIAVRDYDRAYRFFTQVLGAIPGTSGDDRSMKYLWQNMQLGDLSRLELLTATESGSFLDGFLKNREGGFHHMTLQTPDIEKAAAALDKNNIPYFDYHAYGSVWKELFIHPRDAFGILIQIAEFRPDDWIAESAKMPGNKKWAIEKNSSGLSISFAHPGGGTVKLDFDENDVEKLVKELKDKI